MSYITVDFDVAIYSIPAETCGWRWDSLQQHMNSSPINICVWTDLRQYLFLAGAMVAYHGTFEKIEDDWVRRTKGSVQLWAILVAVQT